MNTTASPHTHSRSWRYLPLLMAIFLLVVAASRMIHLPGQNPDADEIWSVWQTFGTPQQIVTWTPYDWPPLYYLALGAWTHVAGITPVMVRLLSVLVFLPGVACLYAAVRRMADSRAAWLAAFAFSAFGYSIFLSILIRGYAFLVALAPAMLWLTLRYFARPKFGRAVWLGLCMAVMFYTHYTSVLVFALIGLFTLIVYRGKIWRWWLPGLIAAILAGPLIVSKLSLTATRASGAGIILPPPLKAIPGVFGDFTGAAVILWAVLFILATLLAVSNWRQRSGRTLALAMWVLAIPAMYFSNGFLGFRNLRYMWWGVLCLALWIGWGLARLPRDLAFIAGLVMILAMFTPIQYASYSGMIIWPWLQNFDGLSQHIQGGDVVLIDPKLKIDSGEGWDYFTRIYFPQGLDFVTDPTGYRRVWYASIGGNETPDIKNALMNGRVAATFFGPPTFLFRLYEAPADTTGILFENGMRFHGVDLLDNATPDVPVRHEGETLRLRLWWSVDQLPALDYSIGVYFMAEDGSKLLSQTDGPPQLSDLSGVRKDLTPINTSQLLPGSFYVDEREITIPDPTSTGTYAVYLTVYDAATNTKVAAPGVNADKLLLIQRISVKSW